MAESQFQKFNHLKPLSLNNLNSLNESSLFSFGFHGFDHFSFSYLKKDELFKAKDFKVFIPQF